MSRQPQKPLISLCMIVKNEAETLARCLKSVHGAAGELIVVDTGSTDATVQIARSFGAKVISFPWNGDFAAARNAGLQEAGGTWILVLDADEELDAASKEELLLCAAHTEYEAFFLQIHNHQGTSRSSQVITVNPLVRMFRNRAQYRFSGIIHEQIAAAIVQTTPGAAMHLSSVVIHHYGYADGIVAKKDKISRNISLLQEQLKQNPADAFHHFNMAVEYMRLGEYEPALQHIRRSLEEVEPDTSYVHLLHKYEIRCLAARGELRAALDACDRGIASFPDYPDLHHLKGVLLLQAGAFAAAKTALRMALDIGVSPPGYHTEAGCGTYHTLTMLGQLYQEIGEDREALVCYTRAAQLHPAPDLLTARVLRTLKCAGRESEITSWLTVHLPECLTVKHRACLEMLLTEGCYAAAAEMIEAAGDAAGSRGADGSEAERADARAARYGADGARAARYGADAGAAAAPAESLVKLLGRVAALRAERLRTGDLVALLNHPQAMVPGTSGSAAQAAVQLSRAHLIMADRILASLPPSSDFAPVVRRVRLTLPLSRTMYLEEGSSC